MMSTMTPRGKILLGAVQRNFQLIGELEKTAPQDVDQIYAAIVMHIRSSRPMALTSFDTGPVHKFDP